VTAEPVPPDIAALLDLNDAVNGLALGADPNNRPSQFFRQLTAMVAGERLYAVAQLLRAGTGATVAAAAIRGLLETAAVTLWESTDAAHDMSAVAALGHERLRVMETIDQQGLSVPNWERWLAPIGVTYGMRRTVTAGRPDPVKLVAKRSSLTSGILGMSSAVADLLSMAGHANAAAARITIADAPHPVGFEPTSTYRAVLAQAAGRTAAFSLDPNLRVTLEPKVAALDQAARAVTLMPATDPPTPPTDKGSDRRGFIADIRFWVISEEIENRFNELLERVTAFAEVLMHGPNPYAGTNKEVNLSAVLPYLTALGTAEVCFASAWGDLPGELSPIAARMLLEEGARTQWTFSDADIEEVTSRYHAVLNDETRVRASLRARLTAHAVPASTVDSLLDSLPKERVPDLDTIRPIPAGHTNKQVPPYEQMLRLGMGYAEPGWLTLAYRLLSQMTHMTPLGLLHSVARTCEWGPTVGHEMTALAVDAAAIGATRTVLPHAGVIAQTTGQAPIDEWASELWAASHRIHTVAQLIHFLD
jgi:hypothetical protein